MKASLTHLLSTHSSGYGIVTQEFCERKWRVSSIDNSEYSNATVKSDIMKIEPKDLEFVPDFIWYVLSSWYLQASGQ